MKIFCFGLPLIRYVRREKLIEVILDRFHTSTQWLSIMKRIHIKRNINLLRNIKTIIYYKSHLHLFSENYNSDFNYFYVIIGDKTGDVLTLLIFLYSHANKLKPIWGLLYRSRRKVFLILLCKLKINYSYSLLNLEIHDLIRYL